MLIEGRSGFVQGNRFGLVSPLQSLGQKAFNVMKDVSQQCFNDCMIIKPHQAYTLCLQALFILLMVSVMQMGSGRILPDGLQPL